MRILICNERFLFRFGVDRVLLLLGTFWKAAGHEVIMIGNRLDPLAVEKCSDRFIPIPEAPDYLHGNEYTRDYIAEHWDEWFDENNTPDIALVAGWPFYCSIDLLKKKCGCAIFHDYGAVPLDGMNEAQRITQLELRKLRKENLRYANRVVAISKFLEDTQSKIDLKGYNVPTSYVHLGIDHLDMHLWDKGELNIEQNDVIKDIMKFKEEGYKIIFQPGRWENGNYKNSAASLEVIKKLNANNIKHKILVLTPIDNLDGVPEEMKSSYYGLGFVDDSTMRRAMELSDAGLSPTLWEGFDLPLGEMQYLDKHMFVINCGAHPEVACNPYYLCKDIDELSDKLIDALNGKTPFSEEDHLKDCKKFREVFTWQNSADELLAELKKAISDSTTVFIDVTNASHDTANSGVMRVTRKISHFLQERMNTVFVLWDDSINKYVFPYDAEVNLLCSYGGPDASKIDYRSVEGQARSLLDDVMGNFDGKKIHFFTETVSYKILQKTTPYLHSKGISVAAIFYDAIAILRPELVSTQVSENHKKYMLELANCDVIIPIEYHNQTDLEKYWDDHKVAHTLVKSVDLAAEMAGVERNTVKITGDSLENIKILFVSTLEPRKNHIRFLKGFEKMLTDHPELNDKVTLHLVGNRYAGNDEIPKFVEEFCKKHTNTKWLGVVDDETLRKEYSECTFTAYPSEIEGFGMPIIESAWFGKPCLCNESGSIGNLGGRGGCCLTNVLSEDEISKSLYKMITDKDYLVSLQHQATERDITTWDSYADSICDIFAELKNTVVEEESVISAEIVYAVKEYLAGWSSRKVITVGNFYPPNFVGGAEIIAHNQAKYLVAGNHAKVIAFSLDAKENNIPGSVYSETFEDILILRVCVSPNNFNIDGINFFSKEVNKAFDELCEIVKPTVVHCHNIMGASLGIFDIAKDHGAKTCVTLHDNWGFCYKNTMLDNYGKLCSNVFDCASCKANFTANGIYLPIGVRKSYFRRIFERIDAYISPSQYLADTYIQAGFDFHKMNVLWNGIDFEKFNKVKKMPSDKIRITTIAYFGKHKGIETLIRAVGLLERKDIEIDLVGSGEEQENYKKIAAECGVLHQLRFWGKLDNRDIGNAYAETDIYCLPSIWPENQPVSITEAMACGIPVVASDLGGSKELVLDGKTGLIFEAGEEKDLAEKLKTLIEDKELREKYGAAGKAIMEENTFEKQVRKLVMNIYDQPNEPEVTSKKIIAFKSRTLPRDVDKITDKDVLFWEWIILEKEQNDIVAFVLPYGVKLTKKEMAMIKSKDILVLADVADYKDLEKKELRVQPYKNENDLMRLIAEI